MVFGSKKDKKRFNETIGTAIGITAINAIPEGTGTSGRIIRASKDIGTLGLAGSFLKETTK